MSVTSFVSSTDAVRIFPDNVTFWLRRAAGEALHAGIDCVERNTDLLPRGLFDGVQFWMDRVKTEIADSISAESLGLPSYKPPGDWL